MLGKLARDVANLPCWVAGPIIIIIIIEGREGEAGSYAAGGRKLDGLSPCSVLQIPPSPSPSSSTHSSSTQNILALGSHRGQSCAIKIDLKAPGILKLALNVIL